MPAPPILYAGPSRLERPLDLVFVHGMSAGSWIWERSTIPLFAAHGYRCWAPDLASQDERARGRGGLELYADRLDAAIRAAGRPVAVIGHSLGAAVAQNLLRRGRRPAGMALICPVPPYGLGRASLEMLALRPNVWRALAGMAAHGIGAVPRHLIESIFLPRGATPDELAWLELNLRDEPMTAMVQAMGWRPIAPPPVWMTPFARRTPTLVIGGARDPLTPPLDIGLTALWHGGTAHVLPRAGHLPMLEPDAAAEIGRVTLAWLERLAPG